PVAVLGAGSWGTTLARYLARAGASVRLWGHDAERTRNLAVRRENAVYLPGFELADSVLVTSDVAAVLEGAALVVLVVPSHHVRDVLLACRAHFPETSPLLIATKGIEVGSLMLMSEVAAEALGIGAERLAVLSGPSFALEV